MLSYVIWEILTRNHIRLLSLTHLQPTMCILGLDRGTTWQKLIQLLEDAMAEWCSELPPRPSDLQGAGSSPAGNWVIFLIDVCFYVICFNWNEYRLDLWRSKALSCLVSMRIKETIFIDLTYKKSAVTLHYWIYFIHCKYSSQSLTS